MDVGTKIDEFVVLSDGWTAAPEGVAIRGGRWTTRVKFHATAFLLRHPRHGLILVDTGYSRRILELNSIFHRIYRTITPAHLTEEEGISGCLRKIGFRASDISHVILTHLHPDHIGGSAIFLPPKSTYTNPRLNSCNAAQD